MSLETYLKFDEKCNESNRQAVCDPNDNLECMDSKCDCSPNYYYNQMKCCNLITY